MGCQCANKEEENKSEILKEQNEEYEQDDNNNRNSNSKEGIFNLEESNQEQNQEKSPSQNQDNEKENSNENEYQENEPKKIKQDKNNKYSDYPEKMLNLINIIRSDPASYADIIEDSIQNITEEQDRNDESKTRIIYKKKVKVALNRGEIAFKDAADELRNMEPLPPLELSSYLREQVKVLREKTNIDVFFKDLIKIPEVSALLMIVDDSEKNPGKKRQAVLNKDFKYIGISSKFIGKTFIAYFAFSK